MGYFGAAFEVSEVRVEPDALQRERHARISPADPRYTFGEIEVVGDFLERRRLIDAYIPFHTG